LFWRTNALSLEDIKGASGSLEALSVLLPDTFHDYVFGVGKEPTKENVIRMSNSRRAPKLSIYVVSSNDEHAKLLKKIWVDVPCRMYLLRGNDFFTKKEGRYDGMGVDRCAALLCAANVTGFPALVFDGGTAMTYTAVDQSGKIMGGGITLGLGAKLRSIADATGALPFISPEECMKLVEKYESGTPLPVFATDTKEAMMVNVLSEVDNNCRNVIDQWLSKVGRISPTDDDSDIEAHVEEMKTGGLKAAMGGVPCDNNNTRTVLITGGDADILMKLLAPNRKQILEAGPTNNTEPSSANKSKYTVKRVKNAIHFGIAALLERKVKNRNASDAAVANEYENMIVGQRVAKKFPKAKDADGDSIFRGTVVVLNQGNTKYDDLFKVRYDDNDTEDLSIRELRDALLLFSEVGDKVSHRAVAQQSREDDEIRKSFSKDAAGKLGRIITEYEEAERNFRAKNEEARKKAQVEAAAKRQKAEAAKKAQAEAAKLAQAEANAKRKRDLEEEAKAKPPKRPKTPAKTYKDRRIAKFFDDVLYFGTIVGYVEAESDDEDDDGFWKIAYDDGDTEEYDIGDLNQSFKVYEENKMDDHMAKTNSTSKSTDSTKDKEPIAQAPAAPAAPAAASAPDGNK